MLLGILVVIMAVVTLFVLGLDNEPKKVLPHISVQDTNLAKGALFEAQIADSVRKVSKDAIIIQNCILNKKGRDGQDMILKDGTIASKEIDVIVISSKGIFAFEAKNYSGTFVSGDINETAWNISYTRDKVYRKYSPYKQVTEAIVTMKKYLPEYNIQKFVVFPDSTRLSTNLRKEREIIHFSDVSQFFKTLEADNYVDSRMALTPEAMNLVADVLKKENERARAMHNGTGAAEHIKYVEKCQAMAV
jgi:hypothetical protein